MFEDSTEFKLGGTSIKIDVKDQTPTPYTERGQELVVDIRRVED